MVMVSSNSWRPPRKRAYVLIVITGITFFNAEAWSPYRESQLSRLLFQHAYPLPQQIPHHISLKSTKPIHLTNAKRSSLSSTSAANNDRIPASTSQLPKKDHQTTNNAGGKKNSAKYQGRESSNKNKSKQKRQNEKNNYYNNRNATKFEQKPFTRAKTVSELVHTVRTVMHTKIQPSRGQAKAQTDWRTAWSILQREATLPHKTITTITNDSASSKENYATVLPVRVYNEILECMKKEKRCWQDAIQLVQYMERDNTSSEYEMETKSTKNDTRIDKYNSRPWYIPSPNYEIYHTLIECCSNNGGGKDAHEASVYWLNKMLLKVETDIKQEQASRIEGKLTSIITNRDRKLIRNSIQLVLGSLSKQQKWRDALQLLEYMEILSRPDGADIPLSVVQYNTVLTCLARSRQVGQCQRLLQRLQAKSKEIQRNTPYVAPIIKNEGTSQQKSIPKRLHPDEISYNAVIGACASAGRWKEALKILDECYREPGVTPNIYIYTNAMRACAKGGNTKRALSLLQVVKDKGLPVDSYCYTAVIDACVKGKQWKKALELFDEMEAKGIEPTQVTYSVTISALGNGLQWERALWLLNLMREKGMSVNLITYNAAITALAKSSKNQHSTKPLSLINTSTEREEELWPKVLDLLKQMDKDGIKPDSFCYSSAINCCSAEGRWKEACDLIETMKRGGPKSRPSKVAYTAAITACGRAGQGPKALELFQNMRDDGLDADRVAYNALFSALRVSKDPDKAYELWGEICGRRGKSPTATSSTTTARDVTSPDIITLTDCIATLSSAGYTAQMDEVFREAVEQGIVLGSNNLDEQWEIDLSGLPFPIARAATRYLLQNIISSKYYHDIDNSNGQKGKIDQFDDKGNYHLQDMVFITGIGKAKQKIREESSEASTGSTPVQSTTINNVLERKDQTTSLRDFIQGILETDFDPPLDSTVPARAQGTVVIEENILARWLNEKNGKVS